MMAISTKLALLVFVLPLSILIISDIIGFLIFKVLYIEVIAIFTSNWVFLLVWERLRTSLDKKLDYLDESIFISLYDELKNANIFNKQNEIESAKNELQKIGKFTIISLYPKNLPNKLNDYLKLHNSFIDKFNNLLEIAQKAHKLKFNKWMLLDFLGIQTYHSMPSSEQMGAYSNTLREIKENNSQFYNEFMSLYNKVKTERKTILIELEEFLKQNSLRLQPKPTGLISAY